MHAPGANASLRALVLAGLWPWLLLTGCGHSPPPKPSAPAKIAAKPVLAIKAAKEAVLKAANAPLDEGLDYERKSFYLLFASEDRSEGMRAFLEKRKPDFKGK